MSNDERTVGWHSKDVARAAGLVIALYRAVQLLWFANQLVLVTFIGVLFGLAVGAGVDRLQARGVRRGVGAGLIVFTFFLLLFAFGAMIAPTVREQSAELRTKIPEAVDRIEAWIDKRQSGIFGIVFLGRGRDTSAAVVDTSRLRVDSTRLGADTSEATKA